MTPEDHGQATRLTPAERRAIHWLAEGERPHDPWGVITSGASGLIDGQAWINWRTVNSLERKGFVETRDRNDPESCSVRLVVRFDSIGPRP